MGLSTQKVALLFIATSQLFGSFLAAEVNPLYISLNEEKKYARLGEEVAIYGYPLVMMNLMRQYATYVTAPTDFRAPINQFAHAKEQPTPLDLYPYPNIDVLTSNAWLDLSSGPQILHIPEIAKRHFLFEIFDGWTNILETITKDNQDIFISGPDYKGKVPSGLTAIRSTTSMVYIKGMIQVYGTRDYSNLYAIQQNLTLTPLANYQKSYSPPAFVSLHGPSATKEPAASQVSQMAFTSYFNTLGRLLMANPPAVQDVVMRDTLGEIGILTTQQFDSENVPRLVENGLDKAYGYAQEKLNSHAQSVYTKRNHWKTLIRKERDFGRDYLRRALVAQGNLAASLSQNLLTFVTDTDSESNRLNGQLTYRIHIAKEEMPPVDGFWSLTLYNDFEHLAYSPNNVYAIQSFADWLVRNPDGSLDIYIQREKPQGFTGNWLPCPQGGFNLVLRLYQPKAAALDGDWLPFSVNWRDP